MGAVPTLLAGVPPPRAFPPIEYPADLPPERHAELAEIDAECTRTARLLPPPEKYWRYAADPEATGFLREYNAAIARQLEEDARLVPAFGLLARYDGRDSRMYVLVDRYMQLVRAAADHRVKPGGAKARP